MGGIGHWTKRCFNLRHRIQDLIDVGLLRFEKDESKVTSSVKGNVEGSPQTYIATKGGEGLDSSLLTSSPVAPFPEAGVTQARGHDDNRAEPSVVDSYGVQVREILTRQEKPKHSELSPLSLPPLDKENHKKDITKVGELSSELLS